MNSLKVSCCIVLLVLVSCIPLDIKNEQHFSEVISIVVNENKDIKNSFSTFSLDIKPEGAGVCGLASYTVDFENQPAGTPPFEAKYINWIEIDTSAFRYIPASIADSTYMDSIFSNSAYKDTLLSVASVLNLDHFMFITATQKVLEDDIYSYELLCDADSVITVYLSARLDSQGVDTIPVSKSQVIAFDILPFLEDQIQQGNDSLIRFNLQYASRTDSTGKPKYLPYRSNPVKLPIIK